MEEQARLGDCPASYSDQWPENRPVLVDPKDWRCGFISRADVADFLVKQIQDDASSGKRRFSRTEAAS